MLFPSSFTDRDEVDSILTLYSLIDPIMVPINNGSMCNGAAELDAIIPSINFAHDALPTGFMWKNEPTVCGGSLQSKKYNNRCLQYDKYYKRWRLVPNVTLPWNQSFMESVTFSNGSVWLLGGGHRADTYLLSPSGSFTNGPRMPQGMQVFCAVRITDSQIFVANSRSQDAFLFDSANGSVWTKLPKLPYMSFDSLLCALAANDGQPKIIADNWSDRAYRPSMVFDITQRQWSWANEQKEFVCAMFSGMFSYGESVISLGGFIRDFSTNFQIGENYQPKMFDVASMTWKPFGKPSKKRVWMQRFIELPKSYHACSKIMF